jgi:hypothetical protein
LQNVLEFFHGLIDGVIAQLIDDALASGQRFFP